MTIAIAILTKHTIQPALNLEAETVEVGLCNVVLVELSFLSMQPTVQIVAQLRPTGFRSLEHRLMTSQRHQYPPVLCILR